LIKRCVVDFPGVFEHFSAGHTGRQAVRPAEPAKHQLGQAENIDQLDYA